MSFLSVKRAWASLGDDERQALVDFLHAKKVEPLKDKRQNFIDLANALKGLDAVVVRDDALADERRRAERLKTAEEADRALKRRRDEIGAQRAEVTKMWADLAKERQAFEKEKKAAKA